MAASNRIRRVTATVAMVVVAVAIAIAAIAGLGLGPVHVEAQSDCPALNVGELMSDCMKYVKKLGRQIPPSAACCDVVKNIDVPCACKRITPVVEMLLSVKKVIYVAQYCGVALDHGSKCGRYTIP